jgi:hypothetical protein
MLVGIPNHLRDPGQSGDLFRSPLCVTTRNYDLAGGIFSLDASNGGARVLVGSRSYCACIEDNNVCLLQSSYCFESAINELALYSGAIGLRRPTAKILYVKACHSHIVT